MDVTAATNALAMINSMTSGDGSLAGLLNGVTGQGMGSPFGPDYILSSMLGGGGGLTTASLLGSVSGASNLTGFNFNLGAAYGQAQATPQQQMSKADSAAQKAALKAALTHIDSKEFDEAREILDAQLKKHPNSANVVHTYGVLKLEQGDYAEAQKYFRRSEFLAPGNGFGEDADNALLLTKDDAAVMKTAKRLVADPNTLDEGLRLLANLTSRSPKNSDAHAMIAEGLIKKNDIPNAIIEFQSAVASADSSQLQHLQMRFKEIVKLAPDASYAHRLLGQTYLKEERYADAATELGKATELSENNPEFRADEARAHVGLAAAFLKRNDIQRALTEYEKARDLSPTLAEVQSGYATALLAHGRDLAQRGSSSAAVVIFRKAADALHGAGEDELKKQIAQAAYSVGVKLVADRTASGGKVGDEIVAFQTAHDLDESNTKYTDRLAETRDLIGQEFLADKKYTDAAAAFQRAYDLKPTNTTYRDEAINAYKLDGDQALLLNKYDDAIKAFQGAYALNRDDAESKSKLGNAFNVRGLFYKTSQKLHDAAVDFREALGLFPDNTEYQANFNSVSTYL